MCRRLAQKEGMLVGGSAGLNLHAAVEISKTAKPGSVIVAILADNGVKYLTKIYNNDWIKAKVWPCLLLLHWMEYRHTSPGFVWLSILCCHQWCKNKPMCGFS